MACYDHLPIDSSFTKEPTMFADRVIPSRALPVLAAALAFLFAPAAWAICTAGKHH
jgi:hypothetical protein